eukprot:TRINITY_DN19218_c0_g1_i1.p1 TRINITY_DN19218_c0_g1~~TRINITY_DN19218_c0_g1_i1.p1  ORF type:complete len:280 (-),score=69.43 TRINITY_DN19218_c0_g1_i1:523-1362(-)
MDVETGSISGRSDGSRRSWSGLRALATTPVAALKSVLSTFQPAPPDDDQAPPPSPPEEATERQRAEKAEGDMGDVLRRLQEIQADVERMRSELEGGKRCARKLEDLVAARSQELKALLEKKEMLAAVQGLYSKAAASGASPKGGPEDDEQVCYLLGRVSELEVLAKENAALSLGADQSHTRLGAAAAAKRVPRQLVARQGSGASVASSCSIAPARQYFAMTYSRRVEESDSESEDDAVVARVTSGLSTASRRFACPKCGDPCGSLQALMAHQVKCDGRR